MRWLPSGIFKHASSVSGGLKRWRQLKQDRPEFGSQPRCRAEQPGHWLGRVAQSTYVGQIPAGLDRHDKVVRDKTRPLPAAPGPHCAAGEIAYGPGETGILFYVKSSLTGDESDYVLDYKRRNPDFPHETTGDQFFGEEQLEAYRALGFHIMANVPTERRRSR